MITLIVASLTSCFPWDNPSPERSQLVADPAAKVRMPGADELAHFRRERELTVEGPAYAFDSYAFGTSASEQEVIAFYDQQLRGLGWTRDDLSVFPGSTDLKVRGWCKPRMSFRLAIQDQSRAYDPTFYQGQTFRTVFEANLQGRDGDVPCPQR